MSMTPKQRVQKAIQFQKPDRLPFNFWLDRRRMAELDTKYGKDFRLDVCGTDVIENMLFPPFPIGKFEEKSGTQWMVEEAFQDWDITPDLPMPDPQAPELFAALEANLKQYPDHAHLANIPNVLTVIEMMRRQENFYMDMLMYPEQVSAFFHRMSDVMAAIAERACQLDIAAVYVQDDVAYNNGLMMGEEPFREIVMPHWKKVIDTARRNGKPVFFHTDGKVDTLFDCFADEMGVNMLNPLQPNLHDLRDFKKKYHSRLGVYGGLDTANIHNMTPDQAKAHVFDLFEKLGTDGGLIMSSHDIDYTVPDENLLALAEAARECTY